MSKNESKEAALGLNDQMLIRRQKMEALREQGIDPFGHRFERSCFSQEPWKERPFRLPDALCLFAVTEKFLLWSFLT